VTVRRYLLGLEYAEVARTLLDTDHLSVLEHASGHGAQRLAARLASAGEDVATTFVTYEEQTRGWQAHMARSSSMPHEVEAFQRLRTHLDRYAEIPVIAFDEKAAAECLRLQRSRVRIGVFDRKIAAIVLSQGATLLSRNLRDFQRDRGLKVEDWCA
jgi:tRNA(fMet)-specific endonuclease VapC